MIALVFTLSPRLPGEQGRAAANEPGAEKTRVVSGPSLQVSPDPRLEGNRLREGTQLVDQKGYFRPTGNRLTFSSDDGKFSLVALENLNLQRIARTMADFPGHVQWKVCGTVTEYAGANYLLIERAMLKTQSE
jgi:hypothetical protein